MFDCEVLVFELRAVNGEGTGPVVPLEITTLDHELGNATGGHIVNQIVVRRLD